MARSAIAAEPPTKDVGRSRRLRSLLVALAAIVLLATANAASAAPPVRQPTLLWKTYPLVQDPASLRYRVRTIAAGSEQPLPLAGPTGSGAPSQAQLLLLLGSLTAALAGLLFVRSAMATAFRPGNVDAEPEPAGSEPMDSLVALPSKAVPMRFGPASPELSVVPPPTEEPGERDTASPAPRAESETCKVVLWHSHLKHQLYVASLAQDAGWRPLGVSPFFRLDDEDVPTEQAATALRLLVDELEREGWTVVSEGKRWYELKLARPRG